MISLSEVLAKMEKNLTDLEWEQSWISHGDHWAETLDDFDRMTKILKRAYELHKIWLEALEKLPQ